MRSLGLTPRDYASFARADQGVLAAHKWFDMAGYEQMWQQRLGGKAQQGPNSGVGARYAYQDYTAPAEPAIFDWWVGPGQGRLAVCALWHETWYRICDSC
jgi:hypothetical protein